MPNRHQSFFNTITKLARATTEQRTVAILNQITADSGSLLGRFDPANTSLTDRVAALVGFNLFLFSGGRTYEYEQVREWLPDAGFTDVSYSRLKMPEMSIVIGRKPL